MKNFYVLNAGEFFAADEIRRHRRDLSLYLPLKDKGADLLAVSKTGRIARIQVKESRTYSKVSGEFSWHEVAVKNVRAADYFLFVSYVTERNRRRLAFRKEFSIIPQQEFLRLCKGKRPSNGKYRFHFQLRGAQLFDLRGADGEQDLSRFRHAWQLIK